MPLECRSGQFELRLVSPPRRGTMEARRGQSSYDVSFWLLIRPNTGFGRAKNV